MFKLTFLVNYCILLTYTAVYTVYDKPVYQLGFNWCREKAIV